MSTLLVDSGYPTLPFFVGDHGIDSNRSVTIGSASAALVAGTVLAESGNKYYKYTGTGGFDPAKGILFSAIDPTDGDVLGALYVHGVVRSGSLTGIDSGAIADLSDQIQFV
jgi:hypothetical protein